MTLNASDKVFLKERLERAREIMLRYPDSRSALLPLLHELQDAAGYVTQSGMREIADLLGITPAEVLGTASFYTMFKLEPIGDHLVSVCTSLSCQLYGADVLYRNLLAHFAVANKKTTADGVFTFEEVECAAACGGAPCLQIDYKYFEFLDPEKAVELLEDVRNRGLSIVHEERGSVNAPLPPLTPEEVSKGPAPVGSGPLSETAREEGHG